MLHTVTDEFLENSYTRNNGRASLISQQKPSQKFTVDPQEFRAKLRRKIEELRRLEVSDSQIIKEFELSREDSIGSLPASRDSAAENSLFMTYLQHGSQAS